MILILANDQVYVLFYFTCVNLIFPSCFMIIVFKSFFYRYYMDKSIADYV